MITTLIILAILGYPMIRLYQIKILVATYRKLKKEVQFEANWEGNLFLCSLSQLYSKFFREDLKERLINIDFTDPYLRNYKKYLTSELIIFIGSPMWHHEDSDSRIKFINRVIRRLW